MRGQGEGEEAGWMSQQVAGRGSGWGGVGWGMTTGGGQVSGEGEGGATALRTQRPEWAACVDPGARTA